MKAGANGDYLTKPVALSEVALIAGHAGAGAARKLMAYYSGRERDSSGVEAYRRHFARHCRGRQAPPALSGAGRSQRPRPVKGALVRPVHPQRNRHWQGSSLRAPCTSMVRVPIPSFSVNCAALPGTAGRVGLFGHEKGRLHRRHREKIGLFQSRRRWNALFLDESVSCRWRRASFPAGA